MDIQRDLQEAYRVWAKAGGRPNRNVRLPSTLSRAWAGDKLLLRLNARSVTANMQSDAAAFEAWALVLRLWLGLGRVRCIELDWDAPTDPKDGHYQRFLYRVTQFQSLFPEWFSVADVKKLRDCRALTAQHPILNVAAGEVTAPPAGTSHPEYELECRLIASPAFRQHFRLKFVDRQFPVGLFADEVIAKTRIFTGGKSAIDIVGVGRDDSFHIFELKAKGNIHAGIVSELLLYTALIREAASMSLRIKFKEDATLSSRACVHATHVRGCTSIHAVMLVEDLHPLLEHPELLCTLNVAAESHWNSGAGAKPVCFSKALISNFEKVGEASA